MVKQYPETITIFLRTRSWEDLEARLRGRGTEDEAAVQRRLEQAKDELAQAGWYRHQVVNDELDRAVREICEILVRNGETQHV